MSIKLPRPIAAYFAAENAKDAGAVARCFAANGIVRDEGHTYKGTHAIERWNAEARAKYHHTVVPLSATKGEGAIVVVGRVTGDFPGSPVDLQNAFELDGEKIASLEIR